VYCSWNLTSQLLLAFFVPNPNNHHLLKSKFI
jgi:hypothetical protein